MVTGCCSGFAASTPAGIATATNARSTSNSVPRRRVVRSGTHPQDCSPPRPGDAGKAAILVGFGDEQ